MPTFHNYRFRASEPRGLFNRLWELHDDHPLPAPINRTAREVMYGGRRLRHLFQPRPAGDHDEFGDRVVGRQGYHRPVRDFAPPPLSAVEARFRALHVVNEYLRNGDGSWEPHPYSPYAGGGIPIEEVSERVRGYLAAFEAFGDPLHLQRAEEGARYLLDRRVYADGHLRMEGHLVVELEYTFAGRALLELWEHDPSRVDCLDAAVRIADRLLEEHRTGALDHAAFPAQLLAPLYRATGRTEYIDAALDRVMRTAVAFQLPYGGWKGADSWIGYHSSLARSVIDTYVALPNTLENHTKKDRLARCVTAALNRVLVGQQEDGRLPLGRGDEKRDYLITGYAAELTAEGFVRAPFRLEDYSGMAEMDFLLAAHKKLGAEPAAVAAHGLSNVVLRPKPTLRPEFDTAAVGQYARFLRELQARAPQVQRRLGMPQRLALPVLGTHAGDGSALPVESPRGDRLIDAIKGLRE